MLWTDNRYRLERLLLKSTLPPALFVIVLSGCLDYFFASKIAQGTQDSILLRTAFSLTARLVPDEDDETPQARSGHFKVPKRPLLETTLDKDIEFVMVTDHGEVLAGSSELMALAQRHLPFAENPEFSDEDFKRKSLRTVRFSQVMGSAKHHVFVSEAREKKAIATNLIFWNTLWPNLLLLIVVSLVLIQGTRKALLPLQNVCDNIDDRLPGDLSPIQSGTMPLEVQKLIKAMNRLLERLSRTNQEQQVFLSGAAHQLRTPLAGIQTQLELAIEESSGQPRARMESVLNALQGLSHCSLQMLSLARSSSPSSASTEITSFDLCEVVQELASLWLDTALKKKIELVFELSATTVQGSRWMLQEMLANLLDNAIKYSPSHSEILVRCRPTHDQQALVEVMDQGPGIAPEELEQILTPFHRGFHPGIHGSGLGLSIANVIIKRHGGRLDILSTATGTGTLIQVWLPREHTFTNP